MSRISFGPEGWSGLIAREFTFANVAVVAQAVAMYADAHAQGEQGVIVGFDEDVLSHLFAERAAEVLAGNGVRTLLLEGPKRREEIASYVVFGNLTGALMISGAVAGETDRYAIRFLPAGAGVLSVQAAAEIEERIREIEAGVHAVRVTPYTRGVREGRIQPMVL